MRPPPSHHTEKAPNNMCVMHPNLFILGAQKAGTTWLAAQLAQHPDVFFSDPKEPHFFSDPKEPLFLSKKTEILAEDYQAYLDQYFRKADKEIWRAEGSTTYLQWPQALDRMCTFVTGEPRFIVCLRHPLSKAISFFIHNWRRDRYPAYTDLKRANALSTTLSPRHTSLYASSIKRWLQIFPRERFLFLRYDDLQQDPVAFYNAVTDFLNIPNMHIPRNDRINAGLPLIWNDDVLTTRSAGPKDHPVFPLAVLESMHDDFLPDITETEQLTGLDLSKWRGFPRDLLKPDQQMNPTANRLDATSDVSAAKRPSRNSHHD